MKPPIKPIFIIGVPRSGTTMIYDIMAKHSQLAWFSQSDYLNFLSNDYLKFLHLRKRHFSMREWKYPPASVGERFTYPEEIPMEFGHFWNVFAKNWINEDNIDPIKNEQLRQYIELIIKKKGKKRFLAKYPNHSVQITFLRTVFPDAKFINVIRDGRAVVASMIKKIGNRPKSYFGIPLKEKDQMDYDLIERHALQWVQVNQEILKSGEELKKEQKMQIKYEDFILNPEQNIKEIFEFCELEFEDVFKKNIVNKIAGEEPKPLSKTMTSQNSKWLKKFTQNDLDKINPIMKELLERFEYA